MAYAAYVTKHLGAPAVYVDLSARTTTLVHALQEGSEPRLVARLHETQAQRVRVLDPMAPPGRPVTYRIMPGNHITPPVTRASIPGAVHLLTDSRGRRGVEVTVLDLDGADALPLVDTPTTTGVASRWGHTAEPTSLEVKLRSRYPEGSARLLHLLRQRTRLILLHDRTQCPVAGCLEPDARVLTIRSVSSEPLRSTDTRRAVLSVRASVHPALVDDTAYHLRTGVPLPGAPVLTWSDWIGSKPSGAGMPALSERAIASQIAGE